jgi:hypothetical protein
VWVVIVPVEACSFVFTANQQREHHGYACSTCWYSGRSDQVICATCAIKCHSGHSVRHLGLRNFVCRCPTRPNGQHLCKIAARPNTVVGRNARFRSTRFLQSSQQQAAVVRRAGVHLEPVFLSATGQVPESEPDRESDGDGCCIICMDQPKNTVFYKCGHLATCIECGSAMQERGQSCPICRQVIVDVVRVFHS